MADQTDEGGVVQAGATLVEVADQHVTHFSAAQSIAVDEVRGRPLALVTELLEADVRRQDADTAQQIPGRENARWDTILPVQAPGSKVLEILAGQFVEVLSRMQDHLGQHIHAVSDTPRGHAGCS
ncbi:hypothetical protein BSL84_27445 [Streptomyces sp. TN58]|nr:hypothetical protein BSL84_27445 [Streptomyces sp. TN58]